MNEPVELINVSIKPDDHDSHAPVDMNTETRPRRLS